MPGGMLLISAAVDEWESIHCADISGSTCRDCMLSRTTMQSATNSTPATSDMQSAQSEEDSYECIRIADDTLSDPANTINCIAQSSTAPQKEKPAVICACFRNVCFKLLYVDTHHQAPVLLMWTIHQQSAPRQQWAAAVGFGHHSSGFRVQGSGLRA